MKAGDNEDLQGKDKKERRKRRKEMRWNRLRNREKNEEE